MKLFKLFHYRIFGHFGLLCEGFQIFNRTFGMLKSLCFFYFLLFLLEQKKKQKNSRPRKKRLKIIVSWPIPLSNIWRVHYIHFKIFIGKSLNNYSYHFFTNLNIITSCGATKAVNGFSVVVFFDLSQILIME